MALSNVSSEFDVKEMERYLKTRYVGRHVIYKQTTQSTMDDARELLKSGIQDGSAVLAETQTKGRGQDGHVWYSQDLGNIYVTFIFRRPISLQNRVGIQDLEFVGSCAVLRAIVEVGVTSARLKWKNDIWCCGRKICGALVESVPITEDKACFLLGIGVNVNSDSRRHPHLKGIATSVRTELEGKAVSRERLFANICNHLEICLETERLVLFKEVERYQLFTPGSLVNVHNFIDYKLQYSGVLEEIKEDWRCTIKDLNGEDHIVGDGISLRPSPRKTVFVFTKDSGKDLEMPHETLLSFIDTSEYSVKTINTEEIKKGSLVDSTNLLVIGGQSLPEALVDEQQIQTYVEEGGSLLVVGQAVCKQIITWFKDLKLLPTKQNAAKEGICQVNFENEAGDSKHFYNYQSDILYHITRPDGPMKSLATTETNETIATFVNVGRGRIVVVTFDLFITYADLTQSLNISAAHMSALTNSVFERDQFFIKLLKFILPRKE